MQAGGQEFDSPHLHQNFIVIPSENRTPKGTSGERKQSGGLFYERVVRRRVPKAKLWVVKQAGFAKRIPDSPHLHHVATNYAEFAFKASLKSSQRFVVAPFPQKASFSGAPIKKIVLFFQKVEETKVFF